MEWRPPLQNHATPPLRAPDDGIRAGRRPRGWLAESWNGLLRGLGAKYGSRLARGRTYARSGRVRNLWFSPGLASAEVVGSEIRSVTLRVRVYDEDEWARVQAGLLRNLEHVAALLEGELPRRFFETLAGEGLAVVPTADELDGDCDCEDFLLPCEHMAAVHNVLADALEGEPFLLLTLRGRTREQLMADLRRAWGDPQPLLLMDAVADEPPPDVADWYDAPVPLPARHFTFRRAAVPAVGLRALGPPPGDADLQRVLEPLYEAGALAAMELATGQPSEPRERATPTDRDPREAVAPEERPMAENAPTTTREDRFTEALVDVLASFEEGAKSTELAEKLGSPMLDVRQELIELEKLGLVYRTGQTRGTRWWLG